MYLHYFYWQYIAAPIFLLRFLWVLQRLLLQLFSVRIMFRTLFAHWHRDRLVLRQGSVSGLLRAMALNAISRTVGFVVRASILLLWAAAESIFLFVAVGAWLMFLAAPLLALAGVIYGVIILTGGGY